ncbi:nuclear transcription factor Y subunit C-2-like [Phalaenopsis equestris]|uniref:nuclear transcription factor Y subunit C-2-like n=1 Tax=Phalaenopsis equestris TaxID=78828 RepID=UPI0009E46848|nr:nuclear transcription factor Y subunit C-2-like [Phalaenopsis equestris]XP_020576659.1 nuclear transcription factor Y subunit C-2-like [Phalaenopsis equestris]XP_020576660.1 nuclear transcription factor Y subunit C-2-like [Phalaenopsis equestris]XP_020576662.1 nuclear transcription factor Y subunit C-2-like [Phalaenopsis equestris]XP_020576663.1 nuclear transcription factor Y subunit C-2-like [Phalaenopsis equestris]
MEQSSRPPQPLMGIVPGAAQMAYAAPPYAPPMATGAPPIIGAMPSTPPLVGHSPFPTAQHQLSYQQAQQFHHHQQQQQQQQLLAFWSNQMHEIEQTTDFKNHSLPLARIKKIMKADEDVRMISAEAPVIFAKACEMFILELTLRSWIHTEENKRRTLQKNDIAAAITRTDIFDFLVDIVPRDELKEDGLGIPTAALPRMGSPADLVPYYYVPVDQTASPGAAVMYASAPQGHPMGYVWPQQAIVQPTLLQSEQNQMPDGG